jgi:hypothetical protein
LIQPAKSIGDSGSGQRSGQGKPRSSDFGAIVRLTQTSRHG